MLEPTYTYANTSSWNMNLRCMQHTYSHNGRHTETTVTTICNWCSYVEAHAVTLLQASLSSRATSCNALYGFVEASAQLLGKWCVGDMYWYQAIPTRVSSISTWQNSKLVGKAWTCSDKLASGLKSAFAIIESLWACGNVKEVHLRAAQNDSMMML